MLRHIFSIFILLLLTPVAYGQCDDINNEVWAAAACTKVKTFPSPDQSAHPTLMIVLHGDAPLHPPDYQYRLAQTIASNSKNLIAVGMLRPGYSDPEGRTSDGVKGNAVGDNYDQPRVDQIAKAIQKLKSVHQASHTILAGHSGGAAITGNLIARYPELVDHAVIVSCPCDINQWRRGMYKLTQKPIFEGNLQTESPIDHVDKVPVNTKITLIAGESDVVAPPALTRQYFEALQTTGKHPELKLVDGGHDIFTSPAVVRVLLKAVDDKSLKKQ